MDKRFLLAISLSLGVWIIWYALFKPVQPQRPQPQHQGPVAVQGTNQAQSDTGAQGPQGVAVPAAEGFVQQQTKKAEETVIPFSTDKYEFRLSNRGGAITGLIYKYKGRKIELVVEDQSLKGHSIRAEGRLDYNLYFDEPGFRNRSAVASSIWDFEKLSEKSIRFFTVVKNTKGETLQIEKIYTFNNEKYFFNLEYRMKNMGAGAIALPNNSIIASAADFLGPQMDFENTYNKLSSIYYLNGSLEHGSQGGGLFSREVDTVREQGAAQWAGLMSRYFLMIMVPQGFSGSSVIHEGRNNHGYRVGMFIPVDTLRPGAVVSRSFNIYVGEKNKEKLAAVDSRLSGAADINWFIEPIHDFLLWCLFKIDLLFGNLGWSLVIFSILTKILLLPLTMKSTESMQRMQELNPKVKEIREKYKDKADIMNKKIMELYKKEKVNPLSGCLPLLLQMPFFFALYSALVNSIDLWNAPFIFWIRDLSLPDTIYRIHGFNINILPVIMTVTTFLQQKMTPGSDSTQQQMLIKMMPVIFIVIFWNMPSGLVLYWIMQNVLQILHQLYINKKASRKAAA